MITAGRPATSASPTTRPVNSEPTIEQVPQRLAARQPALCVEQREPRGGARAARRAVDLAVGEHRHVPLRERLLALLLPEDHAVDVAELGLERVDDLVRSLERAP